MEENKELKLTVILRDHGDEVECESAIEGPGSVDKLIAMGEAANGAIINILHELTVEEFSNTLGANIMKTVKIPKRKTAQFYFEDITERIKSKLKEAENE